MLVELFAGVGLALLYWWEVSQHGLLPPDFPRQGIAQWVRPLQAQFAVHALVIWLMLVGSLIDTDEKTIPDAITTPGTLLGLLIAALYPWSLLPTPLHAWNGWLPGVTFLTLTSPTPWPAWLDGFPQSWSLLIGLGCWWMWCFALMRRTWYPRHGHWRAMRIFVARLWREVRGAHGILGLAGSAGIVAVWCLGGWHWIGLLTALGGAAASGGLVWLVRIIGAVVLDREAMGFGDVTLMAMLGAFLGWQSCLVIFFLAPLAGLVLGLLTLILRNEREIPYGPFLCMAALVVLVSWSAVWEWMINPLALLGFWIVPMMAVGLVVLAILLGIVRAVKRLLGFA